MVEYLHGKATLLALKIFEFYNLFGKRLYASAYVRVRKHVRTHKTTSPHVSTHAHANCTFGLSRKLAKYGNCQYYLKYLTLINYRMYFVNNPGKTESFLVQLFYKIVQNQNCLKAQYFIAPL